jgi:hypothetical protein
MKLDLTSEETDLLREVLDSTLGDLRYEIADTDRSTFREQLRVRRRLLEGIAEKLNGGDGGAVSG